MLKRFLFKIAKFKIQVAIIVVAVVLITSQLAFDSVTRILNYFVAEPELRSVTIEVLGDEIVEIFNVASLEIHSRNTAWSEFTPAGRTNPGTVTLIWEYDSTVTFGVRNANRINMRRVGNVVFVQESTIDIEVVDASVRNFEEMGAFTSGMFTRDRVSRDDVFRAQEEQRLMAAERLDNELNRATALHSFKHQIEALAHGLALTIIWE